MIRYLSLAEVLNLHDRIISETGGSHGLRDLGMLESALGQPKQTFGGHDLYPGLVDKATALGFSLIRTIRSSTATSGWVMQPWKRCSC